ncbi:glycosyltransferase family 39 protein [Polynucleobacter hallstattensis]|uniref:glycosyltransferase family 39 protein n=1 Tax=Polynucleobacter hallstattensis TaxID=1855586 RepID=UPI001C0D3F84|nr:glycosyltransferase family 39 protein [Polynucleobacter hallstattensis]MBU3560602.1 glycosyltransferase family 39 protein [Polynucleobacter hallstattensis]
MNNKTINGLLLVFLLLTAVVVTFNRGWWIDYKLSNENFFIFSLVTSAILIFLKNKIKYLALFFVLMLINYCGISAVATVMMTWLTSYLIGKKIYKLCGQSINSSDAIEKSAVGLSTIGLIATISSHFQINSGFFYILLLTIFYIFIVGEDLQETYLSAKEVIGTNIKITPLLVFILALCMGYIYMATVLPDLGHDALSMHLNVPKLIADNLKWNYDIKEYIWSVLPMGVEMLYVPTYIFGGEEAIRILNTSFILGSSLQLYIIAKRYHREFSLPVIFALCFLSLPINLYLVGSSFVEPCYIFFILISYSFLIDKKVQWLMLAIVFGYACTMRITGVLFLPAILAYYFLFYKEKKTVHDNVIILGLIFILFSSIPYIYAYVITGNPVFPLMNEIFKSDLWSKSAFYHPLYVNKLGIANIWYSIFESKRYGEFSVNGTVGIIMFLVIPFQLWFYLSSVKEFTKHRVSFLIFISGLFYIVSMFYVQAYLRYVYPGLVLIYLSFILTITHVKINHYLLKIILITTLGINILKIPYASTYLPVNNEIYYDKSLRSGYISLHRPYVVAGQILDKFPEYKNSKILLIGYGYDPVYYYYPQNTIAYSWHSAEAFNVMNSFPNNLAAAVEKLGVNIVVCPSSQIQADERNFSTQCHLISSRLFESNGVYVGLVNQSSK